MSDPSSGRPSGSTSTLLSSFAVGSLIIMLLILPIQRFSLPYNLELVDVWNVIALPLLGLYILKAKQALQFPYILAFLLILIGSLIGIFFSPDPIVSITAIVKDVYLYVWYALLVTAFLLLKPGDMQRVMIFWLVAASLDGIVLLAQFASPVLLRSMTAYVGEYTALGSPRPLGLFSNPNMAASYQLAGFVPLLLLRMPRGIKWILGFLLGASILATGSMSALAALAIILIILVINSISHWRYSTTSRARGIITLCILGIAAITFIWSGMLVKAETGDLFDRVSQITLARLPRSTERRYSIWEEAQRTILSGDALLGIGPDSFRFLDRARMHNDLLEFLIGRGVIGTSGLLLFGGMLITQSVRRLRKQGALPDQKSQMLI